MAGNEVSCGSRPEDMQYRPRVSNRASNGKGSIYTRASKVMAVDERGSSRPSLRSISSFNRVGTSSIVSHGKFSTDLTKLESSSLSSSLSLSPSSISLGPPSNILLGPKDPQVSLSPDMHSALHCRPASSDESGSDSDVEAAKRAASILPAVKGTAGRNSSGYPLTNRFVVAFKGDCIQGGVGPPQRQRRIHGASTPNWEDRHASSTSESRIARIATSSAFSFDLESLREFGTTNAPQNSLSTGSSSPDHLYGDRYAPLNLEEQGRPSADRVGNLRIEVGERPPQRSGLSIDSSSESLGQLLRNGRGSECKRKTVTRSILGRRMKAMSSQGVGFRENNNTYMGLAPRVGQSRRNLSSLSCTSAADVLPSVSNTSAARASHQVRHKRNVDTGGSNDGGASLRGTRSCMGRVASGSNGCVWHMVSNKSSDGPPTELNLLGADTQPARPARRLLSGFHPDASCPRRLVSMESEPVAMSATTAFGNAQSAMPNCRGRGGDSFVARGRNSFGSPSRSIGQYFDSAVAFREEFSDRFSGSSSGVSSRSSTMGNRIDSVRVESGYSSRSTADSLFSSSAITSLPDLQFTSSLSGPPPTRPAPVPRFGSTLTHSRTSQVALPSPFFSTSSPHGSGSLSFLSSDDQERQDTSAAGSQAYGALHGSQLHSVMENQARLTVDSLSEILSALEHVERDEELSYEQILMLEATVLLGGIGLHDQHRDMRLDVDNMSYEELLALEERMGNVNTGLNEQDIVKCVKNILYAPFERSGHHVPLDVDVKCSICQEEFQDKVELGLLECGHSHHIACIKQWLLQKNQCPICKATASG